MQIIFFQNCCFAQIPSPLAQLSSSTEAGTRELDGENHGDDGDDDALMKMVMMMMMAVKKLHRKMRAKKESSRRTDRSILADFPCVFF